jgi:hypothetical protein
MADAEALTLIEAALDRQAQFALEIETGPYPTVAPSIRAGDFRLFIPESFKEAFDRWEADQR